MGKMRSLAEVFSKEEFEPRYHTIYMDDDDSHYYYVIEEYCDNPQCSCGGVLINLHRAKGNSGYEKEPALSFYWDLKKPEAPKIETARVDKALFANLSSKVLQYLMDAQYVAELKHHFNLMKTKKGKETGEHPLLLKMSRNEPCPCGSGKKYKKCCLAMIGTG